MSSSERIPNGITTDEHDSSTSPGVIITEPSTPKENPSVDIDGREKDKKHKKKVHINFKTIVEPKLKKLTNHRMKPIL